MATAFNLPWTKKHENKSIVVSSETQLLTYEEAGAK